MVNVPVQSIAVFNYDFAVNGGAVGALVLAPDSIPTDAYVVDVKIVVQTAFTSGGAATIALGAVAAGDLRAAQTLAAGGWNAIGGKAVDDTGVVGGSGAGLIFTIAAAALTAGKAKILVKFVQVPA